MKTKSQPETLAIKMEKAEQEVIQRLFEYGYSGAFTPEKLFWLRVDLGMLFLTQKYGEEKAAKIWVKPEFWTWFRWVWHDNDMEILDWCIQPEDRIQWREYAQTQFAKATKYEPDQRLLRILTK